MKTNKKTGNAETASKTWNKHELPETDQPVDGGELVVVTPKAIKLFKGKVSKKVIDEINHAHEQIVRDVNGTITRIIEIGEKLISVKAALEHGEWLPWVEANLNFTPRTAQRYIGAAEKKKLRLETEPVEFLSKIWNNKSGEGKKRGANKPDQHGGNGPALSKVDAEGYLTYKQLTAALDPYFSDETITIESKLVLIGELMDWLTVKKEDLETNMEVK